MTTTLKQLTTSWAAMTTTSGTVDVSVTDKEWECFIKTTSPAAGDSGRLLMPRKVYNIVLEGADKLYAKSTAGKDKLIIDS